MQQYHKKIQMDCYTNNGMSDIINSKIRHSMREKGPNNIIKRVIDNAIPSNPHMT